MLRGLFTGLKDLIYPNCCLVCKDKISSSGQQQFVCTSCWDKIEQNLPPFCARCGRHLDEQAIADNRCDSCEKSYYYFDRAFSPCRYTGTIKKLIHEFKYSGKDYLGQPLGKLMQTFIQDYQLPIEHLDYLVPIPLHAARQREREFNQAEILARQIAKVFNQKLLTQALVRIKPTKTQTELDFQQRCQNTKDSFKVLHPELIKGTNLLLVDDVLTTGATSSEAARCLKAAGAQKVLLLTLAN